ncbi:Uncharacterized protein DBV15_06721 [Temnothorax longispinosus]|uniref:RRM domain-containing protein n=1 Tax=Temnothorax longispinosus TaxID=300112 RepID=A0A4S2JUU1_9HYME|nr:Uncharacterized protein DBV15_06721 [Temnothorax longispinosus]
MSSSHILYIVHSRRKILVPKTTDLKYLRETTRLKSPIEYEAAGYYRPRETKERATLVEAYRKRDLIGEHYHIFVGDLSPEIETHTLREAFSAFGEIS